jgi:hypothetical protein
LPIWFARLLGGEAAVVTGTEARGASNAKAKRELGWTLRYPSWRQGFAGVREGDRGNLCAAIGSSQCRTGRVELAMT